MVNEARCPKTFIRLRICSMSTENLKMELLDHPQYSVFKVQGTQTTKAWCIRQAELHETDINAPFYIENVVEISNK